VRRAVLKSGPVAWPPGTGCPGRLLRAKTSTDRLSTWNGRAGEGWTADGFPEESLGRAKESPSVYRLLLGMSRKLRFIPDGGALVEVTCRTVQGRLLLVPSPQLNDIILGVLGRAQRLHPVEIVGSLPARP
jgi:hypothetical protein